MATYLKIAIACGGTGGHTFPGLATGRALLAKGHQVEVLSAGRAIEGATMKGWDGPLFHTGAPKSPARHPVALARSVVAILRHFRTSRPDALLAMGSYASLPPVLAARWLRIPIVLHEANAVPGKSIGFLARFAKAIAISFPGAGKFFGRDARVVLTGLPVRTELLDQPTIQRTNGPTDQRTNGLTDQPTNGPTDQRTNGPTDQPTNGPTDQRTIFVTGGSQGAYAMNRRVAEALSALSKRPGAPRFRVIHQTGNHADAIESTRRTYADAGIEAHVVDFIPAMGGAYKAADIVVARAGAATCAEIALFAKPALFIPLPTAVRDHQFLNASHFAEVGAAVVMRQEQCQPDALADAISALLSNPARLAEMSAAAKSLAAPDAATRLAELVELTATHQPPRTNH